MAFRGRGDRGTRAPSLLRDSPVGLGWDPASGAWEAAIPGILMVWARRVWAASQSLGSPYEGRPSRVELRGASQTLTAGSGLYRERAPRRATEYSSASATSRRIQRAPASGYVKAPERRPARVLLRGASKPSAHVPVACAEYSSASATSRRIQRAARRADTREPPSGAHTRPILEASSQHASSYVGRRSDKHAGRWPVQGASPWASDRIQLGECNEPANTASPSGASGYVRAPERRPDPRGVRGRRLRGGSRRTPDRAWRVPGRR
jgi:hypothetical protein